MNDAFQAARALSAATKQTGTGITVQLPAIPALVPAQVRAILNRLTTGTLRLALHELAGRVSEKAPVSEGHLAQSFGSDPATQEGGIELLGVDLVSGIEGRVFSSLPYAIVMDQGRRPGAPISREGIDAIGLWAERTLGLSAEEARHAKYAIANAIVMHGIDATFFVDQGVAAARPRIETMFAILGAEITKALTTPGGGGALP